MNLKFYYFSYGFLPGGPIVDLLSYVYLDLHAPYKGLFLAALNVQLTQVVYRKQ